MPPFFGSSVHCDDHPTTAEQYDWTDRNATITKGLEEYINYFKKRKNSGFVEGINNKIKVAKRRCYEFSAVKTIFQRLFLDFQGFEIYA
jgi:transposase